jgi:DNA topoisomerase-3
MTALWVCEKYSVAADLARVLFGGIASHASPVIETKKGVRLVYTTGHAVEPAAPEVYDAAYKSWEHQDVTALVRGGFRLVAAPGKAGAVATIEKEIRKADELIVATDAGREGEMIAWEIIERAGSRAPVRRFWASALTDNALKKAAADLLPPERKLPLYHAGRARSRADWIEGLTYTRYFSRTHTAPRAKPLSVGRVQSAVTALIEDRCREIGDFVPQTYYEVAAMLDTSKGALRLVYRPPADHRLEDVSEAQAIADRIRGQTAPLTVKTTPKRTKPVDFMSTSLAQKRAFALWKWKPDRTLDLLQKLYEAKLTTYPRTECIYLSSDHAAEMPALLKRLAVLPEVAAIARQHPEWIESPVIRPASYDDSKLTDHHAIIPTEQVPELGRLGPDEAKLYQLIVRHTVANLFPDFRYDSTTVTAVLDGKPFIARGRTVRELGWRALIGEDQTDQDLRLARKRRKAADGQAEEQEEEDQAAQLPPVANGEPGTVQEASAVTKQTKPPAYFTQASLLDAMVNIDLYIDDPRAKAVLGGPSADQKRGIGTGATRANIIKTVFERGYVEERGTAIHATARGSAFVGLARRLVPWMVNPIHSVEQEAALQAIEAGRGDDAAYVAEVMQRTQETLEKLKATGDSTRIEDAAETPAKRRQAAPKTWRRGSNDEPSTTGAASKKIYFSVPYEKREEARAAGLRWDSDARKWYAPSPEIAEAIKKARQGDGGNSFPPATATKQPAAKAPSGTETTPGSADRVYFSVPYAEKDRAKALGMRFDGERKLWFAPSQDIAVAAGNVFQPQGGNARH